MSFEYKDPSFYEKRKKKEPNATLMAGALAQHLTKVLGAEDKEARKIVFKEVMDFAGKKQATGQEMKVDELSTLEASLKKRLVTLPTQPKSGMYPGSLPGVTNGYIDKIKKRMEEAEMARHRKYDKKGRGLIRDILQAKRNDPWAVLNRDDSESYAREAIEGRADWRKQQARFRSTLDGQMAERARAAQEATDEMHAEWRAAARSHEDWLQSERDREAQLTQDIHNLMRDQQKQLAEKADYRQKQSNLKAKEQRDFSNRIEAEMEKARQDDEDRKNYNIKLMQGYIKETEESEKIKAENKKIDAVIEAKAKAEMKAQMDKSERDYADALAAKLRRQEMTTKRAVGKTWERRYVPDHVQEAHLANQNKKTDMEETAYWARKHHMKEDLLGGLNEQINEQTQRRNHEKAEKHIWKKKYEEIARVAKKEEMDEQRDRRNTNRAWKKDLDENLRDFQYKEGFEPYSMNRTDRVMNLPHFGILSMGF